METKKKPKICIIGAGFSGICAGIKLQTKLDIWDYVIFDENHDFGGTWLTHTYPGCACDVVSPVYSYSFELNPNWSSMNAGQPEILDYLKRVAAKHDLGSKARFNCQVKSSTWDEGKAKWKSVVFNKVTGETTEEEFDLAIMGVGGLRVPNIPEEFQKFKGPLIHSAEWDHSVDLGDKTVAVIGSGCSAVQIIPTIEPKVKRLLSFQRKPAWVVPQTLLKGFAALFVWLFNTLPFLMTLFRGILFFKQEAMFVMFTAKSRTRKIATWFTLRFLKSQIPRNPELVSKLTPGYELGCKRVSPSNDYYKTLAKTDKCTVISEGIQSVMESSILTSDGKEFPIDVLILATGYRVQDYFWPMRIYAARGEDLLDTWRTYGPSHYLGIVTSGSPNAFVLLGPNTAYGHNSVIFSIESAMDWILQVIQEFMTRGAKTVVVKREAEKAFMLSLKERMKGTVWGTHECGSWYHNHLGVNTTLYPGTLISYWRETRRPRFADLSFS